MGEAELAGLRQFAAKGRSASALAPEGYGEPCLPPPQRSCVARVDGRRLSVDQGVEAAPLGIFAPELGGGRRTQICRRPAPSRAVPRSAFNIDRNINYTNVCTAVCDFCAFYRKVDDTEAYVLDRDVLLEKIRETVALGGDQILMQGAAPSSWKLEWYEELLRDIKGHFPQVNVHGFSAPELYHFTKVSKRPLREVLSRLKDAGLGSLPGGGRRDSCLTGYAKRSPGRQAR